MSRGEFLCFLCYSVAVSASPTGSGRATGGRGLSPKGGCAISELFAVLGRPHMLKILHEFQEADGAPLRFNALQQRLAIPPKTLSARLRALVEAGFLSRRAFHETPPRVEYAATRKTVELRQLFGALEDWAGRHSLTAVPEVTTVGRVPA